MSDDEILHLLREDARRLDAQREERLGTLNAYYAARTEALRSEQARLAAKHGPRHPLVETIETELRVSQAFLVDLAVVRDEAQVTVPEMDDASWALLGRVVDPTRKGVPDLIVSLADTEGTWVRPLGHTCTDARGAFTLQHTIDPKAPAVPETQPLVLTVSDAAQKILHRDTRPVFVQPGRLVARTIVLPEDAPCPPPEDDDDQGLPVDRITPPALQSIEAPDVATEGEAITLTATLNDATEPVDVAWDFGDGTPAKGLSAKHTYTEAGIYAIRVMASNLAGTDTAFAQVRVVAPVEIVEVSISPRAPRVATPVCFLPQLRGSRPFFFTWDFGDGATDDGANPTHAYNAPGTYSVTLKVTNEAGKDTHTLNVEIKPGKGDDDDGNGDQNDEKPPDPAPDVWIVEGQVRRDGEGVEGLVVSLYDKDLLFDDVLGTTVTGTDGTFQVLYRTDAFGRLFEQKPDLHLKILDQQGKTLYTSKRTVRAQAGHREVFAIDLP